MQLAPVSFFQVCFAFREAAGAAAGVGLFGAGWLEKSGRAFSGLLGRRQLAK